jgi:hypothetical protein
MRFKAKITDKETSWDYKISFYVVFYFFAEIANATIKTVFPIPDSLWAPLSALWGVVIIFLMLRSIKFVYKRSSTIIINSLYLFIFIYSLSLAMILLREEPLQAFWRGTVLMTFAWWIPVGVSACSVKNKQILYDVFLKWSYPMSILLFACVFFRRSDGLMPGETEYNMFFGFHIVVPALFHINEFYRSHNKKILFLF